MYSDNLCSLQKSCDQFPSMQNFSAFCYMKMTQKKELLMDMVLLLCYVYCIGIMIVPIKICDEYLKMQYFIYCENHRWCCIHSVVNAIVVGLTAHDALILLSSDDIIYDATYSNNAHLYASMLVMALHVYHVMAFNINQCSMIIHHVVMMSVLCIPFIHHDNNMFIIFCNYSLFFLCGLPGGIDYFCMHLCYTQKIERITEKHINTLLNVYIRAPGILYGAFYVYRLLVNNELDTVYGIILIISLIWNAQYWSNETSISYGYNLAKEHIK